MGIKNRQDSAGWDLHPWPRPLEPKVLRIVKSVLGGALVLILLFQALPPQLLRGLMDNLFTVLILLSWAGPARRMMRRSSPGGGDRSTPDER